MTTPAVNMLLETITRGWDGGCGVRNSAWLPPPGRLLVTVSCLPSFWNGLPWATFATNLAEPRTFKGKLPGSP